MQPRTTSPQMTIKDLMRVPKFWWAIGSIYFNKTSKVDANVKMEGEVIRVSGFYMGKHFSVSFPYHSRRKAFRIFTGLDSPFTTSI